MMTIAIASRCRAWLRGKRGTPSAQPVLGDPGRDLGTRADLQLAADVLHVGLGGPRRYGQAAGDGTVRQSFRDQLRHLEFAIGEPWPRVRGLVQETERRL